MNKKLQQYRLIIFDMDGTLYFQRPLQLHMGLMMLASCFHKKGIQEIKVVLKYRKMREHWHNTSSDETNLDAAQYRTLADACNLPVETVTSIIQKWMFQKPLKFLPRYKDHYLCSTIISLLKQGIQLAIYSDYPSVDKQAALMLTGIPSFYSGQKEIASMKPNPKGILTIMSYYNIQNKEDVLMVGDRLSKDGQAALNAGVDYLILKKYKFQRKKQYRSVMESIM